VVAWPPFWMARCCRNGRNRAANPRCIVALRARSWATLLLHRIGTRPDRFVIHLLLAGVHSSQTLLARRRSRHRVPIERVCFGVRDDLSVRFAIVVSDVVDRQRVGLAETGCARPSTWEPSETAVTGRKMRSASLDGFGSQFSLVDPVS